MKTLLKILLCVFALLAADVSVARADGQNARPDNSRVQPSDAQFDKRLPPVLPGEEVKDGNKTIKVWSTTGPVPVAGEPEPWNDKRDGRAVDPNGVGVILDRRDDRHRDDSRD